MNSERRFEEPDPNDADSVLKPRSHREVRQMEGTIFKIHSEQWNNVPNVVFEAIVALTNGFDNLKERQTM